MMWFIKFKKDIKNLYGHFSCLSFNYLKGGEQLRRGSLLFTTNFPGILGHHFIDLRRMKC